MQAAFPLSGRSRYKPVDGDWRMIELVLSIAVLAALALVGGGVWLIARKRDRQRGLLMIGAALVTLANVAILAWPVAR